MKFYNRTKEIAELQRIKEMSYNDHSKLTVITGRRRIGKTSLILLAPFTTAALKEIMSDYKPDYTNNERLALYTYTGGVPKYVELLVDNKALTIPKMIKYICQNDSPFIDEGRNLLIGEFGKKYGNDFSILDAISSGMNTQSQIDSFMEEKSIGGQLSKLETVYEIIKKQRPLFAKEGSQTVRYEVSDNFLRFWFRYIERNRTLIELGNNEGLARLINDDYPTYSGKTLELYFKQKMQDSFDYRDIGSWWEPKGSQNEVDILAIGLNNKKAFVAEVKRQKRNFKPQLFEAKIEVLKTKVLTKYDIDWACLDITDM